MVESIEGFEEVSNGQEKADKELVVQVNKKKANEAWAYCSTGLCRTCCKTVN